MYVGRRFVFAILALILGTAMALGGAEIALRLNGHRAWEYLGQNTRIPIMFEPNPVLGWEPKPGRYEVPADVWEQAVHVTIESDRSRRTGSHNPGSPRFITLGCSFTFGWGVSDEETFSGQIQQMHREWNVTNLGVPAYGAYQSLLRLEEILQRDSKPAHVLYGYMQGHEQRNVAYPMWQLKLNQYSRQGMIAIPYATLGPTGDLIRHPPLRYAAFPLRHYSALSAFLEMRVVNVLGRDRLEARQAVSDKIILDMASLCRAHGIDFTVALLVAQPAWKEHYTQLLGAHDIRVVDCDMPLPTELTVPNDGHPNARAHAQYAACIDRALPAPRP